MIDIAIRAALLSVLLVIANGLANNQRQDAVQDVENLFQENQ